MNSLEAFETLVKIVSSSTLLTKETTNKDEICGYPIDNIRADLKVLEILKKNFLDYLVFYTEILKGKLTQSEFDLVADWLRDR